MHVRCYSFVHTITNELILDRFNRRQKKVDLMQIVVYFFYKAFIAVCQQMAVECDVWRFSTPGEENSRKTILIV